MNNKIFKLKSALELSILVRDNTRDKEKAVEIFDYIDILHNKLLDYQLIIDNIAYNVKDKVEKVK